MRVLLIFSFAFSLISISGIYAENNPNDSKSKEDTRFEAQLLNSKILENGRLMSTYRLTSSDGSNTKNLDISVETRIAEGKDDYSDTNWLLFPVEFRITANLDDGDLSLKDVKTGIFRVILQDVGITVQGLSYLMKAHNFNLGTFQGGEVADVTFNMASKKMVGNTVELVLKARAAIALGAFNGNSTIKNTDTDGLMSADNTSFAFNPNVSGSIGLRISKKILVEIFGEVDYYSLENSHKEVKIDDKYKNATLDSDFMRTTAGLSLKYMPSKSYNFGLSGQKDSYKTKTSFENPVTDKTTYNSNSVDALSTMLTFELRW